MNAYRRGTVLGLTVAETFILLTFLLLIALLGLVQRDEPLPESDTANAPRVWVPPEQIETLKNTAKEARKAQEEAEQARATAEAERDQAHETAKEARKAQEEAEQARATAEAERDQAHETAEEARKAQEEAEQARATAEAQRDQVRRNLTLLRRKGENPPCWYQIVSARDGKTREKPYYVFNVAIYEDSIELAPRRAPPGGAFDDSGGTYSDEWNRLHIEELPYGKKLSDNEFTKMVSDLVEQGRNRQVRTYECVFSVMVWDKTPDHAKKRWKDAHDRIIEGSFSAYTVRDLEWKGVESWSAGRNRVQRERIQH